MFRKRPYGGWIAIAVLLWALAAWSAHRQRSCMKPAIMAKAVQEVLQARDARLQAMLKDTAFVEDLFHNARRNDHFKKAEQLPYYLFAYTGDSLVFWNDDDLLSLPDAAAEAEGHLVFLNNQFCIRKTYVYPAAGNAARRLTVLFPVKFDYSFQNQYLQDEFSYPHYIPGSTRVLNAPEKNTYPVVSSTGHYWLSLDFSGNDSGPPVPDAATTVLALTALLVSCIWLQLYLLHITRFKSWKRGLALTALLVLVLRMLARLLPLPFGIGELGLFSPSIYGYSWLLSSLGDLLLNEIAMVWLLIFVLTEIPYRNFLTGIRAKGLRIVTAIILLLVFPVVFYGLWIILHSLVIDSQISFDVSHFHTIDAYTIIGLLSIGLGIIITEMIARFFKVQLDVLIGNKWLRQLLITGSCLLSTIIFHPESKLFYIAIGWMTVYMILLDIPSNAKAAMLSLQMIFVSLFTSACVTITLHELIRIRDLEKDRIAYAEHLLAQQDPLLEYNFKSIGPRLMHEPAILDYLQNADREKKLQLARRLNALYFNSLANRYQPEFYFYDRAGKPLFNTDTASLNQFAQRFSNGISTEEEHLVFDAAAEQHNYLARVPIADHDMTAGYLILSLALKKNINETVYPELLQPGTIDRLEKNARYAYALYRKGRRITQTSNYNFPASIDTSGGIRPPAITKIRNGYYELRYQEAPDSVAIVAGSTGSWLSVVVLLSYLFGMHLLLSLLALLYRWLLRILSKDKTTPYHFTLRQRIHLGMLIILLLSFVVVGVVTVAFFNERYSQTNRERVHNTTLIIERYIRQYLTAQSGMSSRPAMDSVTRTAEFRYALYTLAASQKTDANIFDYGGRLLIASQEDLYEQGLLAPVIKPITYRKLQAGNSIVEENEYVGNFQFLSCGIPLRNDDGTILGYISVPFFSSERELNDQVSNIVVALINLYAFLFFLSSFLALFISTRLTRTYNMLINQFGRLSLQKNELLEWPYEDEIGVLVREYNKMVRKVEENAAMLAQSERESAWREMARQVAHEIKNPLTPMKLNIQYLQQALQSKRLDTEQLATRVSASIIEQIDNLAYIASEFSNFATMPEAKPEHFPLNTLLQRAIPLYQGEPEIDVQLELPQEQLMVLADYSQLLRVFTNIMQNAMQSIAAEERRGQILVKLLHEDAYAILIVQDNGKGIDADTAEKLFKPYFTTKSSGSGLGLAMSRKIVELWKGSIWFESESDKGTTFFIKLPIEESAKEG